MSLFYDDTWVHGALLDLEHKISRLSADAVDERIQRANAADTMCVPIVDENHAARHAVPAMSGYGSTSRRVLTATTEAVPVRDVVAALLEYLGLQAQKNIFQYGHIEIQAKEDDESE